MFDFPGGYPKSSEDSLFAEQGEFIIPKINFFDSARFAELVAWSKIFDNVPFFSKVTQDVRSFPKVTKDRTGK